MPPNAEALVSDSGAVRLIREHGVRDAACHPAAVELTLGDGRRLTVFDSEDFGREWTLADDE